MAKNLSKLNVTIPASTRCPLGNVHRSALANNEATKFLRNTMDAAGTVGGESGEKRKGREGRKEREGKSGEKM